MQALPGTTASYRKLGFLDKATTGSAFPECGRCSENRDTSSTDVFVYQVVEMRYNAEAEGRLRDPTSWPPLALSLSCLYVQIKITYKMNGSLSRTRLLWCVLL